MNILRTIITENIYLSKSQFYYYDLCIELSKSIIDESKVLSQMIKKKVQIKSTLKVPKKKKSTT